MDSGLFITFEGIDGAGKTTQMALLGEAMERVGRPVCLTREPGGDAVAEGVRRLLLAASMHPRAELLLFLASRAQNVEEVIRPNLERGNVVLCDRYIDSSVAYQGHARGLGRETVAGLNAFATGRLMPHLTVLLDLPAELGLARQTDGNRMEAEGAGFLRRVRLAYLESAAREPERILLLDATLPVRTLQREIQRAIALRSGISVADS